MIELPEISAEELGEMEVPDNNFFLVPDDETKTISVTAFKLTKEAVWILVSAIIKEYDNMAIDEEKRNWMKSVGIVEFPGIVSYMYQFKGHDATWLLTKEDIAKSTLEELQEMYEKDKEEAMHSAETWPGQKMRKFIY